MHHLQPHLFQEKGTGASGVVSHLPKDDAMHAMQWRCNAATSPLVQRTPCHLPALRHRWAERSWPGRVGRKRAAGRFVTANPNQQSRCLRPTCQLLDLLQTKNINSWQWDLVYEVFWNAVNLVSQWFPTVFQKINDALCVTCWFGKFLLRHIHFQNRLSHCQSHSNGLLKSGLHSLHMLTLSHDLCKRTLRQWISMWVWPKVHPSSWAMRRRLQTTSL